jgi:L-amino acid N-acyltransferase YncA
VTVTIRPATAADSDAIAAIHNQGIVDRTATLDTALRTPAERRQWLAERGPRHPVIVAEDGGLVVGWASLNPFNPRAAYDHVVDFSVYVERGQRGRGVGRQLLDRLVDLAREIGYHKLVLVALPHNQAGIAMYTRARFTRVGVYREQGLLDGRWVDTLIMERLL